MPKHNKAKERAATLEEQALAASVFTYPRDRDDPNAVLIQEIGNVDEGDGCRVTLLPHYLLIELQTEEEGGELWFPITSLLYLIGKMHAKTGN